MPFIVAIAVLGILLLHGTGAIPLDSVGGALVIAAAVFGGTLAERIRALQAHASRARQQGA